MTKSKFELELRSLTSCLKTSSGRSSRVSPLSQKYRDEGASLDDTNYAKQAEARLRAGAEGANEDHGAGPSDEGEPEDERRIRERRIQVDTLEAIRRSLEDARTSSSDPQSILSALSSISHPVISPSLTAVAPHSQTRRFILRRFHHFKDLGASARYLEGV
ncbi:hypothetical protein VNI00_000716 [Paramarasmius palmivorus]|uniref:Uncharacterized protein n=1 Tax=Paramarasmius palmivorus TaxID=297713 RepID=A0AAW0E5X2_9AGAR